MKKNDLIKISELSTEEQKLHDLFLRKLAMGEVQGPPVGYASLDKPWLKYYPEAMLSDRRKYNKIIDLIRDAWNNCDNDEMINYYGLKITAKEFFDNVEKTAKSLASLGLTKGDSIVVSLESTVEFLYLFFASESLGICIKNKLGAADEIIDVIYKSKSKYFFTYDYIDWQVVNAIYDKTNVEHIVLISPLESLKSHGDQVDLRENIQRNILSKYTGKMSSDNRNMSWHEFDDLGLRYNGSIYELSDDDTELFSAYTSGTTGIPKEVKHSSKSLLEMLDQMIFPMPKSDTRDTWLLAVFPPSLVSVVVAFMCMPLAGGKTLILDPFCDYKELDLEIMHYEPTCLGLVPVFFNVLVESDRIPEDYDMGYLKILGFGAEPLTTKFVQKTVEFLEKHNCKANFNGGYGNSEGGSEFTIAYGKDVILSGSSGFPLINTTISIFEKDTENELSYNEIGEICKSGAGIMLGYSSAKETDKVLKKHADGKKWLHTGDIGYMSNNGFLFVLGREGIKVYSNNVVYPLLIENKVMTLKEVKEAIVVIGDSLQHEGYQCPYLFIIPEENVNQNELLNIIEEKLKEILSVDEYPEQLYLIDEKPIKNFKIDRKILQKKYCINKK